MPDDMGVFEHAIGAVAHISQVLVVVGAAREGIRFADEPVPEGGLISLDAQHARHVPLQFVHHHFQLDPVHYPLPDRRWPDPPPLDVTMPLYLTLAIPPSPYMHRHARRIRPLEGLLQIHAVAVCACGQCAPSAWRQ
jgi:hypothetical protein